MENHDDKPIYADFWVRLSGILIDIFKLSTVSTLILILLFIISHPFVNTKMFLFYSCNIFIPLSYLPAFIYYIWFNAKGNQTVGKKIFGMLVVNKDFKPITLSRSLFRTVAFIFDSIFVFIGHLVILFTRKDLTARTYVINKDLKNRSNFKYFIVLLFTILFLYFNKILIREYITSYSVPTSAMAKSILIGDFVCVDNMSYAREDIKTGDIIIFKYPPDPELVYIKRCIAVGGQTLEIIDKKIYVDGKELACMWNKGNLEFMIWFIGVLICGFVN